MNKTVALFGWQLLVILAALPANAQVVVNNYKSGSIWFNRGNRAHFEELVEGQQSAMMMEFK
jgi:hypothetical protein